MIPSFSHRPLLRVVKLLYVTIFPPVRLLLFILLIGPFFRLERWGGLKWHNSLPWVLPLCPVFPVCLIPPLMLMVLPIETPLRTRSAFSSSSSLSSQRGPFLCWLSHPVSGMKFVLLLLEFFHSLEPEWVHQALLLVGGCAGRFTNLPYYVICFQLVVVPPDSLDAISPTILVTFTAYIQYCWLLVFFLKHLHCVDFQQVLAFCGEVTEPHI